MANDVGVSTGTGATIAAEGIGTAFFQRVKLVDGASGGTSGIPATTGTPDATTPGLVVTPRPGASVSAQVSGSVTIAGPVTTTQAQATGILVWLAPTQTLNVAIGASTAVATTTQAAVTGAVVWLAPTQTVSVVSTIVTILGTQVVTLATGATIATLLGTPIVTLAQTSVVAQLSGLNLTTTATSGITGPIFWMGASQTVNVPTVSTIVTILGTQVVTLATGATIATLLGTLPVTGTIQNVASLSTILGTAVVSVVPGVSVVVGSLPTVIGTTTQAQGTGLLVWLAPTQTLNIAVATTAVATTTQAAVTGAVVWLAPTQTLQVVSTIATILGTAVVSVVPGVSVSLGSLATVIATTTQAQGTGLLVWLAPTQTLNVALGAPSLAGGYLYAVATTSAMASSTQVLLMSVYNSTGSTLGTSGWTIGSGSVLVIYGLGFGWSQAAANMQMTAALLVTVTGATQSTAGQYWASLTYSTAAALSTFLTNFTPGSLVAGNSSVTTIPFPWFIPGPAVVGLAIAATSSGATIYASINASVVGSMIAVLPVTVINLSGTMNVSAVTPTTTQAQGTGLLVWLAPTQSISVVSTIVTILGTQVVTLATGATIATLLGTVPVTGTIQNVASLSTILGTAVVTLATGATIATLLGTLPVTGTIQNVASLSTILGTAVVSVVPGVSVVAQMSGLNFTTTATSGITGPIFWMGASQTVNVPTVSTIVTILGTLPVTGTIQNVASLSTILGTAVVSVVPGVSVVVGSLPTVIGTTTQAQGTGLLVWLAPTQTLNIAVATTAVATTTQAAVTGAVVWFAPTQTLSVVSTIATILGTLPVTGTIQNVASLSTILGTAVVSVVPGVSVNLGSLATVIATTTQIAGTGILVQLAASQTVLFTASVTATVTGGTTVVSGTVSISGTVPVTGTVNVSPALAGGYLYATMTATTLASSTQVMLFTVFNSSGSTAGVSGWTIGAGSALVVYGMGVGFNLNANNVTATAMLLVTATGSTISTVGANVWAQAVYINGTSMTSTFQTNFNMGPAIGVTTTLPIVIPGPAVVGFAIAVVSSGLTAYATIQAAVVNSIPFVQTVAVTGSVPVAPAALVGGLFIDYVTATAMSSSTQVLQMQIAQLQGSPATQVGNTTNVTAWTIGSGSALIIYGLSVAWSQPAANNQMTAALLVTTSGASLSTVSPYWASITFTAAAALSTYLTTGWFYGSALDARAPTPTIQFPLVVPGPAVVGLAIAATSSGATVSATINASIVGTIPYLQAVTGTIGDLFNTTTQAAATGDVVWLAPTQTMAAVSTVATVFTVSTILTVVTILGTQVVSVVPGVSVSLGSLATVVATTTGISGTTGILAWLGASQTVTAALSNVSFTTQLAASATQGAIVIPKDFARQAVVILISSTIAGASSMMLFTVMTGGTSGAAAGTSLYVPPAGKQLRIVGMQVVMVSSAVLGPVQMIVVDGSAAASVSITASVGFVALLPYAIQASTVYAFKQFAGGMDLPAGSTMGIGISGTSHSIIGAIIDGYLY